MKISIVVSCYNSANTLDWCFQSIEKQSYKDYEVIIIADTRSRDGTVEKCRWWKDRFGKKAKLVEKACSISEARNLGASLSKGEIILFLDSDAELIESDYLERLIELFKETGADCITGTPVTHECRSPWEWCIAQEYEQKFIDVGNGFVDFAATTCLAIKRQAFNAVGGFKEFSKKGAFGEDFEFAFRLLKLGYRIYNSYELKVFHYFYGNLKTYLKEQLKQAKARVKVAKMTKVVSDRFTNPLNKVQSLLWITLPFSLLNKWLFLLNLLALIFWNFPITFRIFRRTRNSKAFLLIPLSVVRSFFWLIGSFLALF